MRRLIEFLTNDGTPIFVEVDMPNEGGLVEASPGDVVIRAGQTFQQALQNVRPAAEAIIDTLRNVSEPPDEIQVAFGIKLNAEVGVVLTSAAIEANYNVTLVWKRVKK